MATLRDIKRRIGAIGNTSKITQAMRMVSAAKLRRAQNAITSARPYTDNLAKMMKNLVSTVGEDYSHDLIQNRKAVKNIAVVVVSSDRGMCGSFNTNLLRLVTRFLKEEYKTLAPDAVITAIPVGKKALNFMQRENISFPVEFSGIFQKLEFASAKAITDHVAQGFINGTYDKVLIYYNEFKNLISQVPKLITLLPIASDIPEANASSIDYIFEPNQAEILDVLLPKHIEIQVWKTLLESSASEQAARMVAMENATKNAKDLIKSLQLVYNKERQAAITKEMLEIVGGAEALHK
jgi:F-type H+-transporting ATPase subunit gamma